MYTYVDLFAGCGGLSLGIERSGGELALAVEKSDMASLTFFANFIDPTVTGEGWRAHLESEVNSQVARRLAVRPLREVLDDVRSMELIGQKNVDVVVGGPPCQGFSLAGRRNPADVRNKLPWEYLEFVDRVSPKVVVIENVVGMNHRFSPDEDTPFAQLQQALAETGLGYEVQGVSVNAIHYGAPQNRPRLLIIGVRRDVAESRSLHGTGALWTSAFLDELVGAVPPMAPYPTVTRSESPTVADAIGDLQMTAPRSDSKRAHAFRAEVRSRSAWGLPASTHPAGAPLENQTHRKHSDVTQSRFRLYQWLRANGLSPRVVNSLTSNKVTAQLNLPKSALPAIAPDGTVLAKDEDDLLRLIERLQTRKHSQKALAWDEPARTVVTLPDDYVHPSEARILTVREMARLQGFPDDFVFLGKETTGSLRRRFEVPQYSQVGNAVSPFLAKAVGEMIRGLLPPIGESESALDPAIDVALPSSQVAAVA
ncbi:DNA cytosine methyltransferase [Agromyces sp. NPDC057679]|uniref:DNA cytosine methyltransferase n=1 Tax=Agromyces sp. NPDC057679 TaxID=3346207 RepID=UPI0036706DA7